MKHAMDETARRREIQMAYNEEHGITPQTIKKEIRDLIAITKKTDSGEIEEVDASAMTKKERKALVKKLEKEMQQAASALDFEGAAQLRDMVLELRAMD
jgi:excinuclease ABC subunit B